MPRIDVNLYFMEMAKLVAKRGTCVRRQVGCVLVNERNHVVATGYNGVPAGMPHCIDDPCPGAAYKSGEGLDECQAVHAEQNALLQCSDVFKIKACYTTVFPCMTCVKLLLNTSCRLIFYDEQYAHEPAVKLWRDSCSTKNPRFLKHVP